MGHYFGTDGFRGRVGEGLTAEHAYRIGRVFGACCGHGARVLIGRDTRLSGEMLTCAMAAGIAASGADAYLLGVTTTPSVSYLTRREQFDGAVMVSASHNPYDDNGIKLFDKHGEKPSDKTLAHMEACIDGEGCGMPPYTVGRDIGHIIPWEAGLEAYTDYLISCGLCPLDGMRVGIDCANGGACRIAGRVLTALGVEVTETGNLPDGVNINAGVGSTHISHLQSVVRAKGLDMGFAFDGDADRCIAVDGRGNRVDGDGILYLSAQDAVTRGCAVGGVVGTVLTGAGLEEALTDMGLPLRRTAVGDRHVWEGMKETGYRLGGEPSGHIIYAKDAVTGDGILTAIKVLACVQRAGKPLSEAMHGYHAYPRVEENITVASPHTVAASPAVLHAVAEAREALCGQGHVLVRASGTEPVVRIMCEAKEICECRQWTEYIKKHVADAARTIL